MCLGHVLRRRSTPVSFVTWTGPRLSLLSGSGSAVMAVVHRGSARSALTQRRCGWTPADRAPVGRWPAGDLLPHSACGLLDGCPHPCFAGTELCRRCCGVWGTPCSVTVLPVVCSLYYKKGRSVETQAFRANWLVMITLNTTKYLQWRKKIALKSQSLPGKQDT